MDLELLKKRVSTFRTEKGLLIKVSDELALEILAAWEQWKGPASGFYKAIGVDFRKVAAIMGRAKKLRREGHAMTEGFKEVKILAPESVSSTAEGIELIWEGRQIRFQQAKQLHEFLILACGKCPDPKPKAA